MQTSATKHSSRISIELTASLTSFGAASDGFAVATCSRGRSADSISDGSGNAASTIDSGSNEATILPVAVPVTDSAAVATSVLATAALPIVVACGGAANSASAVR